MNKSLGSLALPNIKIENTYLTKRETQVVFLLTRGKSARDIAEVLFLSNRTVQNYIENIKTKLNVYTKSQLIEKVLDSFYTLRQIN